MAGTPVATEAGLKPIEDVEAGEKVWACDPVTGEWALCEVVEPFARDYTGDIVTLTVEGEQIRCTTEHPFWVVEGEGLSARPWPAAPARRGKTADALVAAG